MILKGFKHTRFSKELVSIVEDAKKAASKYYILNQRPLGITGEVAEFEAIRILKLEQSGPRQKGYDAYMQSVKKVEKVQIKGKVLQTSKIKGRMGAIKKDSDWDSVLLVILNSKFEVQYIYKASKTTIEKTLILNTRQRRDMAISKFISIGEKIWPKQKVKE